MVTEQARAQAAELAIDIGRLEYLDKFLAKAAEDGINPSIEIMVARRGVEIFHGVYGVAAPGGPPLVPDMISQVASTTKVVVAVMLMMLQEDGLFTVRDKVRAYFPEFMGPRKDEVEIWQLLCHTSGMSEDIISEYEKDFLKKLLGDKVPPEDAPDGLLEELVNEARRALGQSAEEIGRESAFYYLRRMALCAPLRTPPRERFSYFSTGYWMLMSLCEKLTGENFDTLTQRRIFGPLGMVDSHMVLPKEKWPRVLLRAKSCRGSDWFNSEQGWVSYFGSSGLKTTVRDMLRFGLMCCNQGTLDGVRILSPASVRAMTRDYNAGFPPEAWKHQVLGSNWTLGWNIHAGKFDDLGILRSFAAYDHAGYGGSRLFIDPENDLVYSSYMVDQNNDDYVLIGKITNILYSALD